MSDRPRGRFPILFTGANRAMVVLGLLPRWCRVEVSADEVRVRMAWAFSARIPRSSIRGASRYYGRAWGWGVHGWRGAWLVNGSSQNLVDVVVDPPARAWTLAFPLRLRLLRVSVTDPKTLVAELSPG